jgi:hypothetical protein
MAVSLFWYKLVFMAELIFALMLTTYPLKRKPHFAARVVLAVLALFAVAWAFPLLWYNAIYTSCMFLILFGCSLLALKFCYQEPFYHLAFCGILAYTTQHIAYETYNFFITITGIGSYGSMYQQMEGDAEWDPFALVSYFGIYALVYWAVWVFVSGRVEKEEHFSVGGHISKLFLSTTIVLVDVVLNSLIVYTLTEEPNPVLLFCVYMQSTLCCILAMGIQFTMLDRQIAVEESEKIQELWAQDKKQYERFRESVELINIKCHDLKHQLRAIRQGEGEVSRDSLEEIEQALSVYNCKVETGNQVLDTILAEKSLLCEHEHIRLNCIAEGAALNFISASDLYSLFGNAISNAVEAVRKTEDLERRIIHLTVHRKGSMIFIHLENYCPNAEQLVFVDGLPQTTKDDSGYHGYGMRSMQMLAEKLGGGMEANVSDHIFNLNFFIPVAEENLS